MRLLALVTFVVLLNVLPVARAAGPNVLFLMSDDLRPDLGCYTHPVVKSPNIDKLARAGVRFDRAYCQYPLCNPSRTSMLTGRHPTSTGVLDNRTWVGAVHPEMVSLPRHFKNNGYVTLRAGKIFHGGIDDTEAWTEGGQRRNFQGATFNPQRPPNRNQLSDRRVVLEGDGQSHNDYKAADLAIEYLRKYKDQPFFLCCGFTKPHSPPTAPKRFFDLYTPASLPLPPDFQPRPTVPEGFPARCVTRNGDLFINRDASPDEARQMLAAYWASTSWMDWNLGRVVDELDRLNLREKTIIVFWGDHGYHLGEKGKWAKHSSLFEIGTRVPLIIVVPGTKAAGRTAPQPVQSIDIYPTLCELCGIAPPEGLEGHSLTPLLNDPSAPWEYPAYTVIGTNTSLAGVAVRTPRYRYAQYGSPSEAMLFDHERDPHEVKNLAGMPEFAEVQKRLAELAQQHAAGFQPGPAPGE